MLGKKKPGESLEQSIAEESQGAKREQGNESGRTNSTSYKKQKLKQYEDLEPNLKIMDYIYTREKKSLNRNSILRPFNYSTNFENLLSLTKRIFMKNKAGDKITSETVSFLDEIASAESLRESKAIIIVPAAFYPGNICIDNAKQFIVDAQ